MALIICKKLFRLAKRQGGNIQVYRGVACSEETKGGQRMMGEVRLVVRRDSPRRKRSGRR